VANAGLGGVLRHSAKIAEPANPLRETRERLEQAERLRQEGKLQPAIAICEELCATYPDYMGALHTLGLLHADRKDYPRALVSLVRAAMLNPRSWTTLVALSGVYLRLGAREMATQTLEQATKLQPGDPSILVTLGEIYRDEREYALAADAFGEALKVEPNLRPAIVGFAMACTELGRYAEAAAAYEGLIKRGDHSIGPLSGLARLPAAFVRRDLLSLLDKVKKGNAEDQADFENAFDFARANILHGLGRYDEAWGLLMKANRSIYLKHEKDVERLSTWQRESLAELQNRSHKPRGGNPKTGRRAISLFILGPSRSGKTTLEGLVGTLEGVKRGYENPIAHNAVRRTFQTAGFLTGMQYVLLPPALDPLCRDIYQDELERRAGSARVFTNTGPIRIHDAERMASILPNVRFLFVKRDPDDVALRIFMTRYRESNFYAYDMRTVREHVSWYYDMIDQLAARLPKISRVIHYEDMVADPKSTLAQAADLCGLDPKDVEIPSVGDDRGCGEPYRDLMAANEPVSKQS
jgi:tetratricopeptide (TPR) repeat protein